MDALPLLSYNQKVYICLLSAAVWIYFRDAACYALIPRRSIFSVAMTVVWVYLVFQYDILFMPLGLFVLFLYSRLYN